VADPFAAGLSALHGTGASVAAGYTPPGGAETRLRVIHEQPSLVTETDEPGLIVDAHHFTIRLSDVALPAVDGVVVIDPDGTADAYRINGDPLLDTEGVSWSCPAEPV
jgi:hypothetical protein